MRLMSSGQVGGGLIPEDGQPTQALYDLCCGSVPVPYTKVNT